MSKESFCNIYSHITDLNMAYMYHDELVAWWLGKNHDGAIRNIAKNMRIQCLTEKGAPIKKKYTENGQDFQKHTLNIKGINLVINFDPDKNKEDWQKAVDSLIF